MIVVPGPASLQLGRKVANLLDAEIVSVYFKTFPDGESYIRLDGEVKGEEVAIIQTTGPPQNTHLIQLFLMVNTARDLGIKKVIAVIPYLAYARQDGRFLSGEAYSLKTIMSLLETCGVDTLITVNSHNPKMLKSFKIPLKDLSAINLLANYFKNKGFEGAFSLSLGKKATDIVEQANHVLKGGCDYVPTQRDRLTGKVKIDKKSLPVKNRDVIIFDDIISSGGTMAKAVKEVKNQGAQKVYAACVHPLLVGDAKDKILKSGADGIVGTDCLQSPISEVSVAPIIADALRNTS
ncbi:ribose-phosphate diphosphokinase [Candidatus Bathyarchaeota archaeon]|nr:ribose-phosphate diphosphokinase [Candidatus Bathyarchaeota archaeon]